MYAVWCCQKKNVFFPQLSGPIGLFGPRLRCFRIQSEEHAHKLIASGVTPPSSLTCSEVNKMFGPRTVIWLWLAPNPMALSKNLGVNQRHFWKWQSSFRIYTWAFVGWEATQACPQLWRLPGSLQPSDTSQRKGAGRAKQGRRTSAANTFWRGGQVKVSMRFFLPNCWNSNNEFRKQHFMNL